MLEGPQLAVGGEIISARRPDSSWSRHLYESPVLDRGAEIRMVAISLLITWCLAASVETLII